MYYVLIFFNNANINHMRSSNVDTIEDKNGERIIICGGQCIDSALLSPMGVVNFFYIYEKDLNV